MNKGKRYCLITCAWLSLALGVIGIFLPLLPTVPLVLLASYLFAQSSPKFHAWILAHPYFGPVIEQYSSGKGIPKRVKIRAILIIWLSMGFSMWLIGKLWAVGMLCTIGFCVSIYLLKLPTAET